MLEAVPSRTARRVAMRRAAHQLVDARPLVFDDPLAVRILDREARNELQRTPLAENKPYSASMRSWMVARARFAEDVLAAGVHERGIRQVLVLGAGLDTFAYRNPFPAVRVFEVDHPATQAWKRELLTGAAIALPSTLRLVPVDFERQSLREQLNLAGFDWSVPTTTTWLGVVHYLTREAFDETVRTLAACAAGSSLVFDYSLPREALPAREQQMLDSLSERVALAGEPFRLFFRPEELAAALRDNGLHVAQDLGCADLQERYFRDRTDGLGLRGSGGRLCHATRM